MLQLFGQAVNTVFQPREAVDRKQHSERKSTEVEKFDPLAPKQFLIYITFVETA